MSIPPLDRLQETPATHRNTFLAQKMDGLVDGWMIQLMFGIFLLLRASSPSVHERYQVPAQRKTPIWLPSINAMSLQQTRAHHVPFFFTYFFKCDVYV